MPYASKAQEGLFHSADSPVDEAEVNKWDKESKGEGKLPEHVKGTKKSPPGMAKARAMALRNMK